MICADIMRIEYFRILIEINVLMASSILKTLFANRLT
jgi:hypothetical protein